MDGETGLLDAEGPLGEGDRGRAVGGMRKTVAFNSINIFLKLLYFIHFIIIQTNEFHYSIFTHMLLLIYFVCMCIMQMACIA